MESVKISEIIRLASNFSVLVPLVFYLAKVRYASRQVHIIGVLIIVAGLSDLIGFILFNRHESTAVVFNTYYALLFLLLSWFYYEALAVKTIRIMIWIGFAVYFLSFALVSIYVQSFYEYQSLMWLITAVFLIIYSIAYFFFSLSSIVNSDALGYSLIWINVGIMIYFCLNLFLFVMGNYVLTQLDPEMSALIWSSHNVNNVLKNVLFSLGILAFRKKPLLTPEAAYAARY
jgi:hypothetical protein